MVHRSQSVIECFECGMVKRLCICSRKKLFDLPVRFSVIMPHSEWYRPTNTGRLVNLALKNSEIYIKGIKGKQLDFKAIIPEKHCNVILFPGGKAFDRDFIENSSLPFHIIVPDGSWKQAKRTVYRYKKFFSLPRISIQAPEASNYRMRRAQKGEYLSTAEAIAEVLGIADYNEAKEHLLSLFREKIDLLLGQQGRM
ncbi:tRNA-uridine aminocarboxypropyltransferase [Spirochaetota bacterium]